jgi:hypothetical protein
LVPSSLRMVSLNSISESNEISTTKGFGEF